MEEPAGNGPSCPVVRALFPASVAANDGRIKVGYKLMTVNGQSMVDMPINDVIELLRKIRGKFRLSFLLPSSHQSDH